MRHGWFEIPGVQTGDRTLEEQLLALKPALAEMSGKSVADFGCAEGLLAIEFALAGAENVYACDNLKEHIAVAYQMYARSDADEGTIKFEVKELSELILEARASGRFPRYDIVLALGVAHKLFEPGTLIEFAADSAKDLVLLRMKGGAHDGVLRSKFKKRGVRGECDVNEIMPRKGFRLEKIVQGPPTRGEDVHYWRRIR